MAKAKLKGVIVEWRAYGLIRKDKQRNVRKGLINSIHGNNVDVVQTGEGQCTSCVMWNDRLSRRCALAALASEAWAIRVSSTVRIGARREGEIGHEGKRIDHVATRVDEEGKGWRRSVQDEEKGGLRVVWRREDVTWSRMLNSIP